MRDFLEQIVMVVVYAIVYAIVAMLTIFGMEALRDKLSDWLESRKERGNE